MPLVDYGSDSDQEAPNTPIATVSEPARSTGTTKRKLPLPSLPEAFASGNAPNDDPALHQGRKRTRPYTEGDYDTHVYLSLEVPKRLARAIRALEDDVRRRCPGIELCSFLDNGHELHVSLTHSFPLRRHQIAHFRSRLEQRLVAQGAIGRPGLSLSLGGKVKVYYNGKRYGGQGHGGRAFLALRVTSGFREINSLVERAIHPLLKEIHRPLYHADPEYHASFAWCLTDIDERLDTGEAPIKGISFVDVEDDGTSGVEIKPTREPIPEAVVAELHTAFDRTLLDAMPPTGWSITELVLKTGKDTTCIAL